MTDVFSTMEYPHWLIVAGAILMLLGFMGNAYRQRRGAEVEPTEMAKQNEQGAFEFEANLAQAQANRKAKLAEQTRQRWANKDRSTKEEPLDDRRQLTGKEPK